MDVYIMANPRPKKPFLPKNHLGFVFSVFFIRLTVVNHHETNHHLGSYNIFYCFQASWPGKSKSRKWKSLPWIWKETIILEIHPFFREKNMIIMGGRVYGIRYMFEYVCQVFLLHLIIMELYFEYINHEDSIIKYDHHHLDLNRITF